MDYKRQQGLRFATPFRIRSRSPWSATAVLRILKNPVYMGILEQGKNTTPSYKVKKRVAKPRGECGAAMVRKTVPSGGKEYIYYVCAAHKNEKTCFSHSIRDTALEKIVLESLQKQIQCIISLAGLLKMADTAPLRKAGAKKSRNAWKAELYL